MPFTGLIPSKELENESNVVEYFIYSNNAKNVTGELLNSILIFINCECHTSNYIWQGNSFNLTERNLNNPESLPHFYGRTYFGDNIEDEWFIVYILYQISRRFEELIVKVFDDDGEFLLIEAAEYLPKWLDPDNADNRVFINQGNLHIIPKHVIPCERNLNMNKSLQILNKSLSETLAEAKIRNCILEKIKGFPERIEQNQHRASCFIPSTLVSILKNHPPIISPIIRAFLERDAEDLELCSTFKFFKPSTRVNSQVRMTRCLYAQLNQHTFTPDLKSAYSMLNSESSEKACNIGLKLAHGAEIICRKSEIKQLKNDGNIEKNKGGFDDENEHWKRFLENLKGSGFFGGELEGSKRYNGQKEQAQLFFISSILPNILQTSNKYNNDNNINNDNTDNTNMNSFTYDDPGDVLMYLLNKGYKDDEEGDDGSQGGSDDDSWMNVCPEELENILRNWETKKEADDIPFNKSGKDDVDFNLGMVNERLKSFVSQESGHLGVEVDPKRLTLDRDDDDERDDEDVDSDGEDVDSDDEDVDSDDDEIESNDDIKFDADNFIKAMENILTVSKSDEDEEYDDENADENDEDGENITQQDLNPTITDYISLMDRELSKTSIGKSFVNEGASEVTKNKSKKQPVNIIYAENDEDDDDDSEDIKDDDEENINENFDADIKNNKKNNDEDDDDDDDDDKEIDIDYNLMKNLLESFSSQNGLSGPSTTLLKSLDLYLPPEK